MERKLSLYEKEGVEEQEKGISTQRSGCEWLVDFDDYSYSFFCVINSFYSVKVILL